MVTTRLMDRLWFSGDNLLVGGWLLTRCLGDDSDDFSFIVEGWFPTTRISIPARQSHVLQGITLHCDIKTLHLDTRLHQHKRITLYSIGQ